jgi:PAS domain S-box-containing protein
MMNTTACTDNGRFEQHSDPEDISGDPAADILLLAHEGATGAELAINALKEAGIRFSSKIADSEAVAIPELQDFAPELVLADLRLPSCGRVALELTRRSHPEIPVIFMSGRVAAEEALAFLREGARDYIFKEDLTPLAPAVLAALKWQRQRRATQQTEERLRVSEVRYRRLFEAAKDGILILDANTGQILDANPFMTELLGYSRAEYLGKHLWEIGAFADLVASQAAFAKLRETGYIRYDNLPLRTKDGNLVDVEFISNVYPEDNHETIQCNIRSITERKLIEKKLFQAQKMAAIGILTGGVAHNINNLLSVIVGNIELLRERATQDRESAECTHEAIEAALRGAELIRHMLAFARQQPLRPKRVDVNDLVSNVVKTIRGLLGDDVEISLHLSSEMVWPVLTDPAQLETSIVNLAVNAREAMPRGGRLSISTCNHYLGLDADLVDPNSAPGDYVELSVSDTGIGMPAEVIQHIFEPFYTTKGLADKPGTGLGLSTVFGFIKQSGGNISVRSGVGVGTTFRLFLPRMEEISQSNQARAEGRAAGGRETVLVVEDNAAVRNVVVRLLQSLGYETIQAGNAPAALTVLVERPIDLLFTDIIIPGEMDGVRLAQAALARWPSLRVLLTSGFGDIASRSDTEGLRVLEKPYRVAELTRALRDTLDGSAPGDKRHNSI